MVICILTLLLAPTAYFSSVDASTEKPPAPVPPKPALSPQSLTSAAGDPLPHELFVEIIQTAYALLEVYAEGPVTSLSLELSDFETVPRERFDEVPYRELATLPEGRVIDVIPSRVSLAESDITHVRYLTKWSTREQSFSDFPEGVRMLTVSLAEALAEIKASDPDRRDVYAFTRYNVVARLDGEQREYVASFLWEEPEGTDTWSFRALDLITQGVTQAALEDLPTVRQARALRGVEAESRAHGLAGNASQTARGTETLSEGVGSPGSPNHPVDGGCIASTSSVDENLGLLGTFGHLAGNHSSSADFRAKCSCGTSCLNKCTPSFAAPPTCTDAGLVQACHRIAFAQGVDGSSTAMGDTEAPSCGFGFGCVVRQCLFCECDLEVGVEVNAGVGSVSVSFSSGGDPDETMNVQWEHECDLCESDPEDPPGGPAPFPCDIQPCSPIVIDMLGDGFRFTDGAAGVDFDILAEGYPVRVAWTAERRDDLFLAKDWDSDEAITDGSELFGNRTAQPKTDEPNGYNALAQFDAEEYRGNQDGKIDRQDRVFGSLWLWNDRNHDGVSDWNELYSMEQAGIEAIYLDYWRSKERDRHGNQLRYFGRVCLSPREDTLASQLLPTESMHDPEGLVLDPMRTLLHSQTGALADTDCAGRIVQSTDVFFVGGPAE
jgi:hypothetical protein